VVANTALARAHSALTCLQSAGSEGRDALHIPEASRLPFNRAGGVQPGTQALQVSTGQGLEVAVEHVEGLNLVVCPIDLDHEPELHPCGPAPSGAEKIGKATLVAGVAEALGQDHFGIAGGGEGACIYIVLGLDSRIEARFVAQASNCR